MDDGVDDGVSAWVIIFKTGDGHLSAVGITLSESCGCRDDFHSTSTICSRIADEAGDPKRARGAIHARFSENVLQDLEAMRSDRTRSERGETGIATRTEQEATNGAPGLTTRSTRSKDADGGPGAGTAPHGFAQNRRGWGL